MRTRRPLILGVIGVLAASLAVTGAAPAAATAPTTAPTLTNPSDGDPVTSNPVLTWTAVSGAAQYHVEIDNDVDFASPLYNKTTIETVATPPDELPTGQLFWRVAAADSGGHDGPFSDTFSFTKQSTTVPTLVAPIGDQELHYPDDPPTFSWTAIDGAKSYTLQIDNADDFIGAASYPTANTTYTLTSPQTPGDTFYWRVQATLTNNLSSDWSTVGQYHITWASTPTRMLPPDTVSPPISEVVLQWTPVAGAATYNLQVSPNGDYANFLSINKTGITSTRYSPPTTLDNGTYFWRVQAVDAVGNRGDWSGTDSSNSWKFSRGWVNAQQILERPTLLSPQWQSGGPVPHVPGSLDLKWSPIHHASRYEIEVSTDPNFSPAVSEQCFTNHTSFSPYVREIPLLEGNCEIDGLSTGVTYYWHVRGIDDPAGVNGLWSNTSSTDTYRFLVDPAMPVPTAPASGAAVGTPALSWQGVLGAELYKVTVKKADGTNIGGSPVSTYATSYTPTTALNPVDGPFTWYVQSVDANGDTSAIPAQNTWWTFTLVAPTTGPLTLTTPLDGTSTVRMPAMSWTPVAGATKYEVWRAANGFQTAMTTTQPYASFTWKEVPLPADTYSWWVVAKNGSGTVLATSASQTFVISQPDVVGSADYGAPCNSHLTCTVKDTPTLTWDAVPNAGWYIVTLAIDPHFTNVIRQWGTAYTSLTPRESLLDNQAGQSFYWFVRPCVDSNESACGPAPQVDAVNINAASFHKSSTPVSLVSPSPGDSVGDQITFTWQDFLDANAGQADQEAKQYTIQVSTTSDFATLLDTATVDQWTYTASTKTYPEGPIWWRVQPIDGSGNPLTWSASQMLTKQSAGLTLTAPGDSATGVPTFEWDAQDYAASYLIEVYKNADTNFSSTNRVLTTTTKYAAWAPTVGLAAGEYAWRVRRTDAGGNAGPWSPALTTFQLQAAAPTLELPEDGTAGGQGDLRFVWSWPVDTPHIAVKYKWQLSASSAFGTPTSQTTVMTSWAPLTAISDGKYYWRVQVLDANGNVVATSAIRSLTLDSKAPTVLAKSPTSSASLTGAFQVTFSEPVQHVSTSTLQVVAGKSSVAGTVTASSTTAEFTPRFPLIPGQQYTVKLTSGITDTVGNPLTPYSWTVRADTNVENNSVALRERWDQDTSSHASGGAYDSSMTAGSSASFAFTGTNVTLLGVQEPSGGYADVYLDGVKKRANLSFYGSTTRWQRSLWSVSGLSNAKHTVQVRVLGTHNGDATGSWVHIDAFKVGSTLYQENNAAVRDAFRRVSSGSANGGSYDSASHAISGDTGGRPTYTMTFVGTGVTLYALRSPGSGSAAVYIDGVRRATVDLRSTSTLYRYPVYGASSLSSGTHTIRVEVVGTKSGKNSAVSVDYFRMS